MRVEQVETVTMELDGGVLDLKVCVCVCVGNILQNTGTSSNSPALKKCD